MGKSVNSHSITARFFLFFAAVGCLAVLLLAPVFGEEGELFEKAYAAYQERKYDRAAELFKQFISANPGSSARDSAIYWRAKSLLQLKEKAEARELLKELIAGFPSSRFVSFAKQELEVLETPQAEMLPAAAKADSTKQGLESCSEYLKKADDRIRLLKEQMAEAYSKSQILENELSAANNDKLYLKNLLDEMRQTQTGVSKSFHEAEVLKIENDRLIKELKAVSALRSAEKADQQERPEAHRREMEEYSRKNRTLEEKNRELLDKSVSYIRETDAKMLQLEKERDGFQAKLKETEKSLSDLKVRIKGSEVGRTEAEALQRQLKDERDGKTAVLKEAESQRREIEVQARKALADREQLEKQVKEKDGIIASLNKVKQEHEALQAEQKKAVSVSKSASEELLKAHAERDELRSKQKATEKRLLELEQRQTTSDRERAAIEERTKKLESEKLEFESRSKKLSREKVELEKKLADADAGVRMLSRKAEGFEKKGQEMVQLSSRLKEAESQRREIEVQARKALADREQLEKQVKEKDGLIASLNKVKQEHEALQAEQKKTASGSKNASEELLKARAERDELRSKQKATEKRLLELEQRQTTSDRERAAVGELLKKGDSERAELEGRVKQAAAEKAELEKRLREQDAVLTALSRKSEGFEKKGQEMVQLSSRLKEAESQRREIEVQARKALADREQLEKQVKVAESRISELQLRLAATERSLSENQAIAKKREAEKSRAESLLKERDGLVTALGKLRQEYGQLETELRTKDSVSSKAAEDIRRLAAERDAVRAKLLEADKLIAEAGKRQVETEREKMEFERLNRRLSGDITGNEKKLKEQAETIAGLSKKVSEAETLRSEIRSRDELLKRLTGEKAELEKKLKEEDSVVRALSRKVQGAEEKGQDAARLAEQLKELERQRREMEVQAKKAVADRESIEKTLHDKNEIIAAFERAKASSEAASAKGHLERTRLEALLKERDDLVAAIRGLRDENKRFESDLRVKEALAGNSTDALQKLQTEKERLAEQQRESERRLTELQLKAAALAEEKKQYEKKLREQEALIQRLEKSRAVLEQRSLEARDAADSGKKLEEANRLLAILNDDYRNLTDRYEALSRQAGRTASYAGSQQAVPQEQPVVRMSGTDYTQSQIAEEAAVSARVFSSLGIVAVPWRSGKQYDDFVIEQLLYSKADDAYLRKNYAEIGNLARKHSFAGREKEYLIKYLTIEDLIRRRIADQHIEEARMKKYYEDNRGSFATKNKEKVVSSVTLPYSEVTKFEDAIVMSEIQSELAGGKTPENSGLIKDMLGKGLTVKEERYAALPEWVRQQLSDLMPEDTSGIISNETHYMVYRVMSAQVYRGYDEVRDVIRNRLATYDVLETWLHSLKSEALQLK